MKSSFSNIHYVVSFLLTCLFSSVLLAQQKGITKADFFDKKVVIIEEVTENGIIDTTNSEIDVPENYTAIRGEFTSSFLISKYNRKGDIEQTIPFVHLPRKLFLNEIVTFVKKDTIQLPDQVLTYGDHFTSTTQGENIISDIWVDERGFILLSTGMSRQNDYIISYQKDYTKNRNSGEICSLINGQYMGTTKWEIIDWGKDEFILNINAAMGKVFSGYKMSFQYKLDKNYNPKSYIEQWSF